MDKTFRFWVSWFLFLFCLDFFIPFYLLKDIPKLTGSFLFWVIWVFVAIISMFAIFLKWQDNDETTH